MDLTEIVEVRQVEGEKQINGYLNRGWKLLSINTSFIPEGDAVFTTASVGRPIGVSSDTPPKKSDILEKWGK